MKTTLQAVPPSAGPLHLIEVIGNASQGGMENYIKNFLAHLPPQQFSITCVCPYESRFTRELRELNTEAVYITPIADNPGWQSIQFLTEIARMHQADVLHAHMPKAHLLAGLAGSLAHRPVVAQIHGMEVTAFEWSIAREVNSMLITNCQQSMGQALAMGAAPDSVVHIPNGVDTNLYSGHLDGLAFRAAIGVPAGVPLVGFVGRLEVEKGADLFVQIATHIHQHMPDVHFVMAGAGALQADLMAQCAQNGLNEQMHFAGWCINTATVYPALDVLVQTTRSDGTSLVVLEAMASNCPVAALAVGGIPELVESGSTGVLAAGEDWHGLANLIIHLLQHPHRLKEMGKAGRERVLAHFDLQDNVRRTLGVLRQAVARHQNRISAIAYRENETAAQRAGT